LPPAAIALLFLLGHFDFKAGGALAALVLGLATVRRPCHPPTCLSRTPGDTLA
jgi:hypothetical protein